MTPEPLAATVPGEDVGLVAAMLGEKRGLVAVPVTFLCAATAEDPGWVFGLDGLASSVLAGLTNDVDIDASIITRQMAITTGARRSKRSRVFRLCRPRTLFLTVVPLSVPVVTLPLLQERLRRRKRRAKTVTAPPQGSAAAPGAVQTTRSPRVVIFIDLG
jgi:hypothetical protein